MCLSFQFDLCQQQCIAADEMRAGFAANGATESIRHDRVIGFTSGAMDDHLLWINPELCISGHGSAPCNRERLGQQVRLDTRQGAAQHVYRRHPSGRVLQGNIRDLVKQCLANRELMHLVHPLRSVYRHSFFPSVALAALIQIKVVLNLGRD